MDFLLTMNALVGVAVSGNSPDLTTAFSVNSEATADSARNESGAALVAKLSSSVYF